MFFLRAHMRRATSMLSAEAQRSAQLRFEKDLLDRVQALAMKQILACFLNSRMSHICRANGLMRRIQASAMLWRRPFCTFRNLVDSSTVRAAFVQYLAAITQGRSEIGRRLRGLSIPILLQSCTTAQGGCNSLVLAKVERLRRGALLGCQKVATKERSCALCRNCLGVPASYGRFWHNLNFSALPPPEEQAENLPL